MKRHDLNKCIERANRQYFVDGIATRTLTYLVIGILPLKNQLELKRIDTDGIVGNDIFQYTFQSDTDLDNIKINTVFKITVLQ